jgi:hypothetical protein
MLGNQQELENHSIEPLERYPVGLQVSILLGVWFLNPLFLFQNPKQTIARSFVLDLGFGRDAGYLSFGKIESRFPFLLTGEVLPIQAPRSNPKTLDPYNSHSKSQKTVGRKEKHLFI